MDTHGEWAAGGIAVVVGAGLSACEVEQVAVQAQRPGTFAERAARAARLAELCERQARWWAVLWRWSVPRPELVPFVFVRAVIEAESGQRSAARFWRDSASDWRRQAAGQPVCAVIGCSCGGTCEVSA